MPTPFESARLNLQLYDLRREPVLREARAWFLADFNPATLEDVMTALAGERNPSVRMQHRTECATILLEFGADLSPIDKDGLTPLAWAVRSELPDMVKWLKARGAEG